MLSPDDFGLLGIAMLSIATLETFSKTGFDTALIQKKEDIRSYLDTAWTISVIRGIAIFVILFFSAPAIAAFFKSAQAIMVIRIVAFTSLLSAIRNIGIVFFHKELEFNKQCYFELSGVIVDVTLAVALALVLKNVWALIWAGITAGIVRVIVSYLIHSYRPRFRLDKKKLWELFDFGRWVMVSGILFFLITEGDDIFVGRVIGISALGLYQMAYLFSNLPATEIAHVISQVTLPFYSKLQNELEKLKQGYLKVLQVSAFLSFPIGGLIFALAPDFTSIFLGDKWMPMVPAMKVLVLAGCVRCIATTSGLIFYAVGKPQIDTAFQFVCFLVLAVLIYPLSMKWGLRGIALSVFASAFIANVGLSYMAVKTVKTDYTSFLKPLAVPLLNTFIAVYFVFGLKCVMVTSIGTLITAGCGAIILYLALSCITDRVLNYGIQVTLKEAVNSWQRS
jgi:O-antigen/teichoic acid export membrane protein